MKLNFCEGRNAATHFNDGGGRSNRMQPWRDEWGRSILFAVESDNEEAQHHGTSRQLSTTGAGSLPLATTVQPGLLITQVYLLPSHYRRAACLTAGPYPLSGMYKRDWRGKRSMICWVQKVSSYHGTPPSFDFYCSYKVC